MCQKEKRARPGGCSSFDLAINSVIRVLKLGAFDSSDDNPITARQSGEWLIQFENEVYCHTIFGTVMDSDYCFVADLVLMSFRPYKCE